MQCSFVTKSFSASLYVFRYRGNRRAAGTRCGPATAVGQC